MRTIAALDDELVATAKDYVGISETSALLRESLKALIAREAAAWLARLGGSEPAITAVPRRRPRAA